MFDQYVEYSRGQGRNLGITLDDVREIPESRHSERDARRSAESEAISSAIPKGAFRITLDETGKSMSSASFAKLLESRLQAGNPAIVFMLGGPDGHDRDLVDNADLVLSLGPMTWPHRLARVMLAEQIYRAITILGGHPYHRQ